MDPLFFFHGSFLDDILRAEFFNELPGDYDPEGFQWATLRNYARYRIVDQGRVARGPTIAPCPGQHVRGKLVAIPSLAVPALDRYELQCGCTNGGKYVRIDVVVSLDDDQAVDAYAYVADGLMMQRMTNDPPFCALEFVSEFREMYLDRITDFLADELNPESALTPVSREL